MPSFTQIWHPAEGPNPPVRLAVLGTPYVLNHGSQLNVRYAQPSDMSMRAAFLRRPEEAVASLSVDVIRFDLQTYVNDNGVSSDVMMHPVAREPEVSWLASPQRIAACLDRLRSVFSSHNILTMAVGEVWAQVSPMMRSGPGPGVSNVREHMMARLSSSIAEDFRRNYEREILEGWPTSAPNELIPGLRGVVGDADAAMSPRDAFKDDLALALADVEFADMDWAMVLLQRVVARMAQQVIPGGDRMVEEMSIEDWRALVETALASPAPQLTRARPTGQRQVILDEGEDNEIC